MAESMEGDLGRQVLQAVQGLSEQVKGLSTRMDKLEARMDRQPRTEFRDVRAELHAEIRGVRMELQLELGHMHERIDRNKFTQLMREMGMYRELELYWMSR